MAKIEQPKANPPTDNLDQSSPEETTEGINLAEVMAMLNKMRTELAESRDEIAILKSNDTSEAIRKRKETYMGPRKYGFKIYEGSPITGYKTLRMETIKNHNSGIMVVIHDIELQTLDGKTHEVEYEVFGQRYQHSDKYFVEQVSERKGKKYYSFNTEEFGTFELPESLIN